MANLATFRTQIAQTLGLDNTAGSAEQVLADSWLNKAILDILMETQVYVAESSATLTAGQGDYTLDSDILVIKDVVVSSSGVSYITDHISPDFILQQRAVTNIPVGPSRYYALNGANVLMLYPYPASGDTLTFYYVPRPTALSNATDDPSVATFGGIPTEWHQAIEWYALWLGGDYADDDSSQQGERYHQLYEAWLKRIKKERSYKGGRRLGAVIPGRRRRPFVPHDNSTDLGYLR